MNASAHSLRISRRFRCGFTRPTAERFHFGDFRCSLAARQLPAGDGPHRGGEGGEGGRPLRPLKRLGISRGQSSTRAATGRAAPRRCPLCPRRRRIAKERARGPRPPGILPNASVVGRGGATAAMLDLIRLPLARRSTVATLRAAHMKPSRQRTEQHAVAIPYRTALVSLDGFARLGFYRLADHHHRMRGCSDILFDSIGYLLERINWRIPKIRILDWIVVEVVIF